MTRVAIIADSHYDESSRFDECVRVHDWIAADIRERGVDLVLHAGDVFERKSTPAERRAVADWLRAVADVAPVVIVRGNHDAVGDLSLFAKLRTRHPIIVEEAAGVHVVAGVAVACLAWPRKAELAARAPGVDPSDALRLVLRGLGQEFAEHVGPRVLLSHAMVRGSRTSTGQPLVGCDMELGLEDLALAGADLVALGHIHMPQGWHVEATPIVYPGSPRRTAFGEVEGKGYVVAEIDRRPLVTAVRFERVPTPCAGMVLLTGEFVGSDCGYEPRDVNRILLHPEQPENVSGAEVRVRYLVAADERAAAKLDEERLRAELIAAGATAVKIEAEVIAASAARAPEVASARTLEEKLRALWQVRGDVDEERARRLVDRAHEIEGEAVA